MVIKTENIPSHVIRLSITLSSADRNSKHSFSVQVKNIPRITTIDSENCEKFSPTIFSRLFVILVDTRTAVNKGERKTYKRLRKSTFKRRHLLFYISNFKIQNRLIGTDGESISYLEGASFRKFVLNLNHKNQLFTTLVLRICASNTSAINTVLSRDNRRSFLISLR